MASLKPLIVRSNRLLGASLVEKGLVSIDEINEASDRLAEFSSSDSNSMHAHLFNTASPDFPPLPVSMPIAVVVTT